MIIPSKHSGYVNCVRLYNGGGSGGGASASTADSGSTGTNPGFSITNNTNTAPPVSPWGTTANSKADWYNTQIGAGQTDAQIRSAVEGNTQFGGPQTSSDWDYLTSLARSRAPVPWGNTQESKAAYYNSQLGKGQNDTQIRSAVEANPFGGPQSNVDWNTLIQTAAMNNPTGRPLAGSGQFYQPVYQGQYQNYNTGNPMGISQYGQQPSGGFPQMQTPFSMYGGQMMGGGYGQFGENNPYSPYSNSFLNTPFNLNQGTMQDKANFYGGALNRGFNDQQVYNQASGLFGQQSPTDWSALQNAAQQNRNPNQAIYSRSSMRRSGPIRAYEEGGIASLLDKE